MGLAIKILAVLALLSTGLILYVLRNEPRLGRRGHGRAFVFLVFVFLPLLVTYGAARRQLHGATSTRFCLSCHEMEPYGRSLHYERRRYLPATHYQNGWVPRDRACYTCHTNYTMFGGVRSKLRGLSHVYVHYLGDPPAPGEAKLYQPYLNRECLHCHAGARRFEELRTHRKLRPRLESNDVSCLDCHGSLHDAGDVAAHETWPAEEAK